MLKLDGKLYYSTSELSFELRKNQELIRKWCREGFIECRRLGRDYFVDEEEASQLKRYLQTNSALRKNWKAWVERENEERRENMERAIMEKTIFWAGFRGARYEDIFEGVTYLRPLVKETIERMKDKARRHNDEFLELLLDAIKGVQHDDSTLSVFLSGRMFYIRNKDRQETTVCKDEALEIFEQEIMFSPDPIGVFKFYPYVLFVSNPEVKNYERYFDIVRDAAGLNDIAEFLEATRG